MSQRASNSNKVRALICGLSGRMGEALTEVSNIKKQFQIVQGVNNKKDFAKIDVKKIDVVIDFSAPDMFREMLAWCEINKKAFVSGTTGLTPNDHKNLKKASEVIPVLWAPNMSLGIQVMKSLIEKLSSISHWDFQIEEIHHNQKKDAPSGTALLLQQSLEKATGKVTGKNLPKPLSARGGGVFGDHKVLALSDEEVISIEHRALSRRVFADGAWRAAEFLQQQKKGLYTLSDVL